jgi:hypothetical protein
MLPYSWDDPTDLKRLSSLLQWLAIGLVFLGGALQLVRFVVDQREKAVSGELARQREAAQLEREAALRSDLQQSRTQLDQLANRDVFRPLAPALRRDVVQYFRTLGSESTQVGKAKLHIIISIENGSRNRSFARGEILEILREAGISAQEGGVQTTFGGILPKMNFRLAGTTEQIGNAFIRGLAMFIKESEFSGHKVDRLPMGTIEIDLNGEPQFNPDGSFSLR